MLVTKSQYNVTGDMPGQTEEMIIAPEALEHIMDALSDLYSDKVKAIVREYTTNALDSHIISGQTKPVVVNTPSRMSPKLVIQDFGSGMSKQTLLDVFRQYGQSTKRNNNLEAGRLGFGAKSAFAYTDQFTVETVKDGHCCQLIMSRNARGAAEMNIAFEYATEEPNGVTVTIPVPIYDISEVERAVRSFGNFAAPGTILIDGVLNSRPSDWNKVGENLYTAPNHSYQDAIVMGNVAYPVELFKNQYYRYNRPTVIAFVEMGEIDFPPSRESVKMTPHSINTINQIEKYLEDCVREDIQKKISDKSTRSEKVSAFIAATHWQSLVPNIQQQFNPLLSELCEKTEHLEYRLPYNIQDQHDRLRNWGSDTPVKMRNWYELTSKVDNEFYAVTDFPENKVKRSDAKKIIHKYSEYQGKTVTFFENSESDLKDLFPKWKVISWNDVKDVVVPKAPRVKKTGTKKDVADREYGKRRGHTVHNRRMSPSERPLKVTGPVYYASQTEMNVVDLKRGPRGDYKFFYVIPSQQENFKKKYPEASHLPTYMRERREQIRRHVKSSASAKRGIEWTGGSMEYYVGKLDLAKITNKDFLEKYHYSKTGEKWVKLHFGYLETGRKFSDEVSNNYPLLRALGNYDDITKEHAILYINMIGEQNDSA